MNNENSKRSQIIGNLLKEKRGTNYFRDMNPNKKLTEEAVKRMILDFKNRKENGMTVPMIAKKYKVTPANVYYHAKRNGA